MRKAIIADLFSDSERTQPIVPKTVTKAVYDETKQKTMDGVIEELETNINAVQSSASNAQRTADAAVPKSGGELTGVLTAVNAKSKGYNLIRGCDVFNSGNQLVDTIKIQFIRK